MTIIALATFERAAKKAGLAQREREALILVLEHDPSAGDLIPGAGGRASSVSHAKAEARAAVIASSRIRRRRDARYLIDIYAKNVKTDLSADERKTVKALRKELLKIHKDKKP